MLSSVTRSLENIAGEMVNNINRAIRNAQARNPVPDTARKARRKSALPVRRPAELNIKHVSLELTVRILLNYAGSDTRSFQAPSSKHIPNSHFRRRSKAFQSSKTIRAQCRIMHTRSLSTIS